MSKESKDEVVNGLLQALGSGEKVTLDVLLGEVPFPEKSVLSVLGWMRTIGLVCKDESAGKRNKSAYGLTLPVTAFHLAKLAEEGADFAMLPKWLPVGKAELAAGLVLASQVKKLKELEDKLTESKSKHAVPAKERRDEVSETLEMLVLAAREALSAATAGKGRRGKGTVAALRAAQERAESALEEYKRQPTTAVGGWQPTGMED